MVRQTVFPFKLERTEEILTAHGDLALLAEFNHGLGLCALVDRYVPGPGSNRGYAPSVFVDWLILMLQAGGRSLEDLRALRREAGLMRLLDRAALPDPDTLGDWLRRMGDPQRPGTPACSAWGRCGMASRPGSYAVMRTRPIRWMWMPRWWKARSEARTGAIKAARVTCPCWGFCSIPRSVWWMSFGKGMCRLGPGTWPSTELQDPDARR
jgi:hypothetical protein